VFENLRFAVGILTTSVILLEIKVKVKTEVLVIALLT